MSCTSSRTPRSAGMSKAIVVLRRLGFGAGGYIRNTVGSSSAASSPGSSTATIACAADQKPPVIE